MTPLAAARREAEEALARLDALSCPEPMSGCTLFVGVGSTRGHGRFWFRGRLWVASRVAWTLLVGEIPAGLCVLHHCDNPACVNVGHLFLGNNADNQRDSVRKGRHASQKKTHCPAGHELTSGNLYVYPRGWRKCLTCKREQETRATLLRSQRRDERRRSAA